MYFSNPQRIKYDGRVVADMTIRMNIIQSVLANKDLSYDYTLDQGDLPENIAFKFYGDVNLHWIILLTNEIYDPFYEWYMTDAEVLDYSKRVYGDPAYQDIRFWVKDDIIYQTDIGNAVAVTNYEYETLENDKRQTIKIIYPEYTQQIITRYNQLINNG